MNHKNDEPDPTCRSDQPSADPLRRLHSRQLMQGCSQIEILHRGEVYRLRITRQGKLILMK